MIRSVFDPGVKAVLSKCGFCASSNVSVLYDDDDRLSAVCGKCEASGPRKTNIEDAISAWNTRAP